jgi:hypothetical protein
MEGQVNKPIRGVINVDIRDSEPDWTPAMIARESVL